MSQIKTKFIEDNAVNDLKMRLRNNQFLRARNSADDNDVNILRVKTATNQIEFASIPLAAGTPSIPAELANKGYVDAAIAGLRDPKDAVSAVADANVDLVTGTLLEIDGFQLSAGDRVLLVWQTLPAENGIYIAAVGAWSRSSDADSAIEVTQGMFTWAVNGDVYTRTGWLLTSADPIVLNTDPLTFVQTPIPSAVTITGGDMVTVTGDVISLDLATSSGLESTNPGNAAGQLRVKTSGAVAVKDRTVILNGSNEVEGLKATKESFTLDGTDVSNQYVDLTQIVADSSIELSVDGGPVQREGIDFTLSYTGGAGGKTRITFAGELATSGAAELVSGDVVRVNYLYL